MEVIVSKLESGYSIEEITQNENLITWVQQSLVIDRNIIKQRMEFIRNYKLAMGGVEDKLLRVEKLNLQKQQERIIATTIMLRQLGVQQ